MGHPQRSGRNGKEIKITIPLIDYGFSGSFNKVLIKITDNKKVYKSITQGLTDKDDTQEYTGSVKIEKYTPFILRGSYSAPLRRYASIPEQEIKCPAFSDPSTPPCTLLRLEGTGKISGKFNIISPWRDDDRINKSVDMNTSFVDPFKNDIKGMVAKFGIDIDVEKEFAKAGVGNSNFSSEPHSSNVKDIYGGCNCSCNFVQSATSQCKTACSAAFSACKGERYKPPKRTVVNNNTANSLFPKFPIKQAQPKVKGAKLQGIDQTFVDNLEKGTVKAPRNLRKKFISILQKNHPGNASAPIRDMMIKGFDSMPDDKSRMMMLKSVEGM